MEEIRTKGIVIDTQDYKEYDKILTILTYDMGVIRAVIKGVKKSTAKSRFAGQVFCFIDIILSKRGEFYSIISCDLIESFFEIAYKYESFLLAVDMVKVIKYISKYNPDSSELFITFLSILNVLLKTNNDNNIVYLKFLLNTLQALGFQHDYQKCDKCNNLLIEEACIDLRTGGIVCAKCASKKVLNISPEEIGFIKLVADTDYTELINLQISEESAVRVLNIIQTLFKLHCSY